MVQGKLVVSSGMQKKPPLCLPVEKWRYLRDMLEHVNKSHPRVLISGGIIGGLWIASIFGIASTILAKNGNIKFEIPLVPWQIPVFDVWLCDLIATTLALATFYIFYRETKRKTESIEEMLHEMRKLEEKL